MRRAFNWATERKWFVGGGKQGAPYYLNSNGCWRAALEPDRGGRLGIVGHSFDPEAGSGGRSSDLAQIMDPDSKIDSSLALISEAIQHVDQKKREWRKQ